MKTTILLLYSLLLCFQSTFSQSLKNPYKLNGVRESNSYLDGKLASKVLFDRNGNKILKKDFKMDGNLENTTNYFYNKKDLMSEYQVFNMSGLDYKFVFQNDKDGHTSSSILYDSNGSIKQTRSYICDSKGIVQKILAYAYNSLEYSFLFEYEGNKLKQEQRLNSFGKVEYIWSYTYDTNGLIKTEVREDKLINKKFIYDYTYVYYPITAEIKDIVQSKVNKWQRKGRFEKTEEFQKRVTEKARSEIVKNITQATIDSLAQLYSWKISSNDYDADNETYKIDFENFGPIYLKIPQEKVLEFEKNISRCKFENPMYSISNGNLALKQLDVKYKKDIYTYNSQEQLTFNPSDLNLKFNSLEIELPDQKQSTALSKGLPHPITKSEVDSNIPENKIPKLNTFALIIGNEDYTSSQLGLNTESNVEYAHNDAQVFRLYCEKTLGVIAENITYLSDATAGKMSQALAKMNLIAKNSKGKAELIFYYAGHGLPDENTKEPFLIPVDVSGSNFLEGGIKLNNVYAKLTEYPSKRVSIFIDACFSGGARNKELLSSRAVKIKPKESTLSGNIVVFSASSGEQSSLPYKDKQHGMFTYYLLKKIQETKGEITLKELSEYIMEQVSLQSVNINNKEQTPVVNAGTDLWKNWKLR